MIWKMIVGNPWVAAVLLALFLFWSAACGGFGYYEATGQYEAALLNQQQAIGAAQHTRDLAQHDAAVAVSKLADARKKASAMTFAPIQQKIEALTDVPACAPPDEVIDLLNQSGK